MEQEGTKEDGGGRKKFGVSQGAATDCPVECPFQPAGRCGVRSVNTGGDDGRVAAMGFLEIHQNKCKRIRKW